MCNRHVQQPARRWGIKDDVTKKVKIDLMSGAANLRTRAEKWSHTTNGVTKKVKIDSMPVAANLRTRAEKGSHTTNPLLFSRRGMFSEGKRGWFSVSARHSRCT